MTTENVLKHFLVIDHQSNRRNVYAKTKREAVVLAFTAGGYTNPRVVNFWSVAEVAE